MEKPQLEFSQEKYSQTDQNKILDDFKNKGYAILPQVFIRETVPKFKAQLEKQMIFNGLAYTIPDDSPHYIHAAMAPRGRQILPHCLSGSKAKLMPSIHTTIIVIETDDTKGQYAPGWHKDREPDGMPGQEYHYPADVFLAFYFEDIDDNHGPTQIIPGSHKHTTLSPFNNSPVESIHLRMEDALLIDQRAWHRGIPRKAKGTRFVLVYGIYGLPHYYGINFQMPKIQKEKWMQAKTLRDRVFFGGPFAPPETMEYNKDGKHYLDKEKTQYVTFPKMT